MNHGKSARTRTRNISGEQVQRLVSKLDAIRNGMVLVPEDRKLQGVVLDHSIAENIGYANLPELTRGGWITARRLNAFADGFIRKFGVKGHGAQNAGELSGGNQQKVVLAKWLARNPRVVVLDEPTRGIDVGAKFEIYSIMNDLVAQGRGVVMISSEMPELLGMCDRIYVMNEGRIVGELSRAEASQERIMALILKDSGKAA